MKILWRILKYSCLGLSAFVVLAVGGLLLYYQVLYQKSPEILELKTFKLIPSDPVQKKPVLLPIPKEIRWTEEKLSLKAGNSSKPEAYSYDFQSSEQDQSSIASMFINLKIPDSGVEFPSVNFIKDTGLAVQECRLKIQHTGVRIEYSTLQGAFYGLTTLKQIFVQSKDRELPGVEIKDKPDLAVRGAMLDISRNKIPTLKTLCEIVDFLADLKYNHLQLYIEGFSFAYPSFKNLWEKTETPLNPVEIKALDRYCKARFIDLVPNQNSLGHMMSWLATKEYEDLAECPEGFKLLGLINMKGTMNPTDPRTPALVKKMSEDLLPNFTSEYFNVNLDEPFELGHCRSKEAAQKVGVGGLYLDYALSLQNYVKSKGKTMMLWGDVVSRSPEIIHKIPKDLVLLEWGYEFNHPFEQNCRNYQKAGLRFMVCPGTSSWSSFTGRTENMMGNIDNAVKNGLQYGAEGMVITDWGDLGHLQYLTVSYAGLAYGAALSWNYSSKTGVALGTYLSKMVFKDSSNVMGDLVLNLGTYNQFEEFPMMSGTTTAFSYQFGFMDKVMTSAINRKVQSGILELMPMPKDVKEFYRNNFQNPRPYNYKAILYLMDSLEKPLRKIHLALPDSSLIRDEYLNAIRMICLGAKIKEFNNFHLQQSTAKNINLLEEMQTLCKTILYEHKRLWLIRNKIGRLDLSISTLQKMQNQIEEKLIAQQKNGFSKWVDRFFEQVMSAGAALYLH